MLVNLSFQEQFLAGNSRGMRSNLCSMQRKRLLQSFLNDLPDFISIINTRNVLWGSSMYVLRLCPVYMLVVSPGFEHWSVSHSTDRVVFLQLWSLKDKVVNAD